MGLYTNKGLVNHAEKTLTLRTKYMWGGILRPITDSYISLLKSIYSESSGTGYSAARWAELRGLVGKGWFGCDCVGLIKSYYWSGKADGGTGSPKYGTAGYPDTNAGGMYAAAKVKGKISTMPELPGIILYCRSRPHVGVYAGSGKVIECTLSARGDGAVRTDIADFGWEYWFECPYIEYVKDTAKPRTLAYPAVIRSAPSAKAAKLGRLEPGSKVTLAENTDTYDKASGYTYVRLAGDKEMWIVRSALE